MKDLNPISVVCALHSTIRAVIDVLTKEKKTEEDRWMQQMLRHLLGRERII